MANRINIRNLDDAINEELTRPEDTFQQVRKHRVGKDQVGQNRRTARGQRHRDLTTRQQAIGVRGTASYREFAQA